MFGHSRPEVLVVGAGPVGLFAALRLTQQGVKVEVLEEEWQGTTHSYALALHPRTLELLDQVGLAQAVLERARKVQHVSLYDGEKQRIRLDLSTLSSRFPFVATLPQGDLEELLREALESKVHIKWNQRLAQLEFDAHGANVEVHELGKDSTGYASSHTETVIEKARKLSVPFVIGADGHNSTVRQQLGIKLETALAPQHFAVFEFDAQGNLPDDVCLVFNEANSNVLWPLPNGRYRWSFELKEDEAPAYSRDKDRLWMQAGGTDSVALEHNHFERLLEERAPWFRADIGDIHWRMAVRFERRLAASFGKQRAWLAGDAGHMASPIGVQSMNVGMREVAELSDIMTGLLRGKGDGHSLAGYSDRREAEWRYLLGLTHPERNPKADSPWLARYFDRLVSSLPASGQHLTELIGEAEGSA